ncbi:NXPE family member 3-like [Saccoglossus kowalevskii]|uniref:NXPE family member 3-like n=1 Tax=Saccoglossus kowalevskii TaxID=10224 RepID=A0ABM0GPU6_SACKO|nr:PREDICTED: NXPE family member 3-like [Saccoglossus kowalevskii]
MTATRNPPQASRGILFACKPAYLVVLGFIIVAVAINIVVYKISETDMKVTVKYKTCKHDNGLEVQSSIGRMLDDVLSDAFNMHNKEDQMQYFSKGKLTSMGMTSPRKSRFWLVSNADEVVHVVIEAYDSKGIKRQVGGDFFFAVMFNQAKASTAGRIIDYQNGTYSVYFYEAWKGEAMIDITLVHTREAVTWLKTFYLPQEQCINWFGTFKDDTSKEITSCYISSKIIWENKCEFSNSNLGESVFLCEKPKNLSCETLELIKYNRDSLGYYANLSISQYNTKYLFESPYLMTKLASSPLKAIIKGDTNSLIENLPPCNAEFPVSISDGFWINGSIWQSLVCKSRHFTMEEALDCLRGKDVYFFGDSTLRLWHDSFINVGDMNMTVSRDGAHRLLTSHDYNLTILFQFHAIRIGSSNGDFKNQRFESGVIDSLRSCYVVVVLSLTYHFGPWTTKSFTERLLHTRNAVERLLSRCPGTIVVIKSSHPRDHNSREGYVHSSDWTLFEMNSITRKLFTGIGVRFLDVYDMSLSHYTNNHVHMQAIVPQQVDLFLSYVCPY